MTEGVVAKEPSEVHGGSLGGNLCHLRHGLRSLVKEFRLHPEGDRTPSEAFHVRLGIKILHFINCTLPAVLIIDYLEARLAAERPI